MVFLLRSHGTAMKSLSQCMFELMIRLETFRARETCAGLGFHTAMRSIQKWRWWKLCGLVQIAEGQEYFVGAIRATNNTAEMQALFWLNTCVEQKCLPISSKVLVAVDSFFVQGLIDEKFVARENRASATLLSHMWKVTKKKVATSHVMGYGDSGKLH